MTLDLVMGGVPRGGTTVAAKFMSLHPDVFCYAGETHLIPFMHGMFGWLPCRKDKLDLVAAYLRQQFMTAMVEMPRFSVSRGAHPANLIFTEKHVDELIEAVRSHLESGLKGVALYEASLSALKGLLKGVDRRSVLGEKTPSNVFAMAEYSRFLPVKNIVVVREPLGVLKSMRARVEGGDAYSSGFNGNVESNIGMYLEYAYAARSVLESAKEAIAVRYEDIAQKPGQVIEKMFGLIGKRAEEEVINFVETGRDREIANRAPMNYRRLSLSTEISSIAPIDAWKALSLTRDLRAFFGYSDEELRILGFDIETAVAKVDVPETLMPLYGFHGGGWLGRSRMKRTSALVAYFRSRRASAVLLEFGNDFPEMAGDVVLRVAVNRNERDIVYIKASDRTATFRVHLKIQADDLIPIGNGGGYVVIDIESSVAYCQLGHEASGTDARESSFRLINAKIDKPRFRFWIGKKK